MDSTVEQFLKQFPEYETAEIQEVLEAFWEWTRHIRHQHYKEGVCDGVRRFAWWRDGVQYVGTCGTTLDKALTEIDQGA